MLKVDRHSHWHLCGWLFVCACVCMCVCECVCVCVCVSAHVKYVFQQMAKLRSIAHRLNQKVLSAH